MDIQELNREHGLNGRIRFIVGDEALPMIELDSSCASARISMHGGQLLSYNPVGHEPLIWLSRKSRYEEGKAIRGGIPICWPWFGAHPKDPEQPNHGTVRATTWSVISTSVSDDDSVEVRLKADQGPFRASVAVCYTVGRRLGVSLISANPSNEVVEITEALHTYFQISAVENIYVEGLANCSYIDKTDGFKAKVNEGNVRIASETDSVFFDTLRPVRLIDKGYKRTIRISKRGSASTVIWNPWAAKSAAMQDLGDDEFRYFVCVECGNSGPNIVRIPPRGWHKLSMLVEVEKE